jgi:hypothetical protein
VVRIGWAAWQEPLENAIFGAEFHPKVAENSVFSAFFRVKQASFSKNVSPSIRLMILLS